MLLGLYWFSVDAVIFMFGLAIYASLMTGKDCLNRYQKKRLKFLLLKKLQNKNKLPPEEDNELQRYTQSMAP